MSRLSLAFHCLLTLPIWNPSQNNANDNIERKNEKVNLVHLESRRLFFLKFSFAAWFQRG